MNFSWFSEIIFLRDNLRTKKKRVLNIPNSRNKLNGRILSKFFSLISGNIRFRDYWWEYVVNKFFHFFLKEEKTLKTIEELLVVKIFSMKSQVLRSAMNSNFQTWSEEQAFYGENWLGKKMEALFLLKFFWEIEKYIKRPSFNWMVEQKLLLRLKGQKLSEKIQFFSLVVEKYTFIDSTRERKNLEIKKTKRKDYCHASFHQKDSMPWGTKFPANLVRERIQ